MILRHWLGRLRPGTEAELLRRLRAVIPELLSASAPIDFTYGFRHEAGRTTFLTLSDWRDFESVSAAAGDDLSRTIPAALDDLFDSTQAGTYERLPPDPVRLDLADGRVIGVVTGRVRPQHESVAQAMVDRSARQAIEAGALAAHLGRRLVDGVTEFVVAVVWPKREAMSRFVRSRSMPAVDPAFTAHLVEWRFETYNALSPERLLVPPEGPAVLILDDEGWYIDTTPSVESVLGFPGELLYGRSLFDLAPDPAGRADIVRRLVGSGPSEGLVDLLRPDGPATRVRYRSATNVPGVGLHAVILASPDEPLDRRPVGAIVTETLGLEALAALEPSPAGFVATQATGATEAIEASETA